MIAMFKFSASVDIIPTRLKSVKGQDLLASCIA